MKIMTLMISLMAMVLLTMGCNGSNAPTCSDKAVTDMVLEIAVEQVQNELVSQFIISEHGQAPATWGNPTYADMVNYTGENKAETQEIVSLVDEQMKSLGLNITAIRTSGVDEEIKKCDCEATLENSAGNSTSIQYTAQDTDDGENVYVEVFGL